MAEENFKQFNVSVFFDKLNKIVEENSGNIVFLENLSKSKINFGQNYKDKSSIIRSIDLFRQVLTFNFFTPSEYWTDSYKLCGLKILHNDDFQFCFIEGYQEDCFFNNEGFSREYLKLRDFQLKMFLIEKKNNREDKLCELDSLDSLVINQIEFKKNNLFEWKDDYKKAFSVSFYFFILYLLHFFLKNFVKKWRYTQEAEGVSFEN